MKRQNLAWDNQGNLSYWIGSTEPEKSRKEIGKGEGSTQAWKNQE